MTPSARGPPCHPATISTGASQEAFFLITDTIFQSFLFFELPPVESFLFSIQAPSLFESRSPLPPYSSTNALAICLSRLPNRGPGANIRFPLFRPPTCCLPMRIGAGLIALPLPYAWERSPLAIWQPFPLAISGFRPFSLLFLMSPPIHPRQ